MEFEKNPSRDDRFYNFSKDVIRKIKLKLKKQDFTFSSYLPNGLKQDVE